jgi:putative FmdB family regulatory protein
MPTYQYQCKNCGHVLEELQSMSEPPLLLCPACNTDNLQRIMGTGAGLIFKGSGFYLTDYKKGSSSPPAATPTPKKPDPPSAPSTDSSSGSTDKK